MHTVRSGLALAVIFLACLFAAGQAFCYFTPAVRFGWQAQRRPQRLSQPLPRRPRHRRDCLLPRRRSTTSSTVLSSAKHYFMAQMRHLHPLVETYLQDLKNDANGNASPVKDQYFLGRLDMSDGTAGRVVCGTAGGLDTGC